MVCSSTTVCGLSSVFTCSTFSRSPILPSVTWRTIAASSAGLG
jgi:hypothetical protein